MTDGREQCEAESSACGYLGSRVARRWIAAGHAVAGLVRSAANAESLAREAVRPIVADVTQPSTLRGLPAADTLLYAVGYDPAGGASRSAVYVDGLRAVLDAVSPQVRRVILISSTGVYAEQGGGWVDESSPCRPVARVGPGVACGRTGPGRASSRCCGHRLAPGRESTVRAGCRVARSRPAAGPCRSSRAST